MCEQRRWVSKGGGLEAVCEQRRWVPMGGGLGVPHQLEKGTSVSKDAGPEGG